MIKLNLDRRVWIFQANPKKFRILDALSDPLYTWDNWKVKQHTDEIKKGDLVLIWVAGEKAGIYAIGGIASDPYYTDDYNPVADKYLVNSKAGKKEMEESKDKSILKVTVVYLGEINPIFREKLKNKYGLDNLSIIKMPQATNFKVTMGEFWALLRLMEMEIG